MRYNDDQDDDGDNDCDGNDDDDDDDNDDNHEGNSHSDGDVYGVTTITSAFFALKFSTKIV